MPILLLAAWGVNSYEDNEAEKGEANDKGGITYYYRESSGADNYPEPVAKLLQMYPKSQATYINVSTDKNNELEGDIYSFTTDSMEKVVAFYKQGATLIDETPDRVEMEKDGQNFVITKEKVLEGDPIKGETKFGITFYNKATVNKYKTDKP
ncbi:MAG: hypothetical protein EOP55_05005 [Sphingobacteriales bacterium]|nr:MAG: hypothetical protein EOP55_05005 [Sphingobacteriales bacterium]